MQADRPRGAHDEEMEILRLQLQEAKNALADTRLKMSVHQVDESRYQLLFEKMSEAFALHEIILGPGGETVDYRFLEANRAFENMTGIARDSLIGRTVREVIPDIDNWWIETYGEVAQKGTETRFRSFFAPLARWYEILAFSPTLGQFAVLFRDITEDKLSSESLAESEEKYRALTENSPDVIMRFDRSHRHLYANPAVESVTGIAASAFVGRSHRELGFPEEMCAFWEERIGRVFRTGKEERVQFEYDGINGEVIFDWQLLPEFAPDGSVNSVLSTSRDITGLREAAQAARDSEERYRAVYEHGPLAFVVWSLQGRVLEWNHRAEEIFGWSRQEILGEEVWRIMAPEERAHLGAHCSQLVSDEYGGRDGVTTRCVTRDGAEIVCEWHYTVLRDGEGQPAALIAMGMDVTEKRRAEETRARLAAIVESSEDAIIGLDTAGTVVSWNPGAERLYGYTAQEIIGQHHTRTFPENRLHEFHERAALVLSGQQLPRMETVRRRKDGSLVEIAVSGSPIRDSSGTLIGSASIARDISIRKNAERALARSRDFYLTLFAEFPALIWLSGPDGKCNYVNETWLKFTGRSLEEEKGDGWTEGVHHDDLARCLETNLSNFQARRPYDMEYRLRRHDGEYRWILDVGRPYYDLNGDFAGFLAACFDVTERRQTEEALRESESRFRALFEDAGIGIAVVDTSGQISQANPAFHGMLGYDEGELLGVHFGDITHPDDLARDSRFLKELMAGKYRRYQMEKRYLRKDGAIVWGGLTVTACRDADGNNLFIIGMIEDITERKRAQADLLESEERYRALFDRSMQLVYIHDFQGNFIDANDATLDLFGFTREEIPHVHMSALLNPDQMTMVARTLEEVGRTGFQANPNELRLKKKNGEEVLVETQVTLIYRDGRPIAVLGVARDITERRRLEEQLLRASRLEMAGRIAGQVAHDFNNLLGPLVGYPDLIKLELPEGHKAHDYCDDMAAAAQQMAEINSDMLVLSRRGLLEQEPVQCNELIEQVVSCHPAPATLHLDLRLDAGLLPASGSTGQLLRVMSNLVANAREAMQDEGTLTITTENVYIDRPSRGHDRIEIGEYVKVTVGDTGAGIPHENQSRIFEPFFSTKKADRRRGSGLGLAIVQSVVEDHKGHVTLESAPGNGTTFVVLLPVYRDTLEIVASPEVQGGNESVLVVDDDPLQRRVTRALLEQLGYEAEAVESGEEALARLVAHPVDLLVLDMITPHGMDGAETYQRAVELRPGQRAILVSGYSETERVQDALRRGAAVYVRKPLTLESLAGAVRAALDGK